MDACKKEHGRCQVEGEGCGDHRLHLVEVGIDGARRLAILDEADEADTGQRALARTRGEVEFRDVSVTYPGQRWTFWQYTGTGIVPGIQGDTDINAFAGSAADWARWLQAHYFTAYWCNWASALPTRCS